MNIVSLDVREPEDGPVVPRREEPSNYNYMLWKIFHGRYMHCVQVILALASFLYSYYTFSFL